MITALSKIIQIMKISENEGFTLTGIQIDNLDFYLSLKNEDSFVNKESIKNNMIYGIKITFSNKLKQELESVNAK